MRDSKGRFIKGHGAVNTPNLDKHFQWKGERVGYSALHKWVKKMLGQPNRCEQCGKEGLFGKRIGWANVSGLYKRELTDWIRLCKSCHHYYDRREREYNANDIFTLQGRYR